jgi:hypothetical protein
MDGVGDQRGGGCARLRGVHDITGTGAADADAATNTADLAKTRAKTRQINAQIKDSSTEDESDAPGSSADQAPDRGEGGA